MGEFVRARGALPGIGEPAWRFIYRGRELVVGERGDAAGERTTRFAVPDGPRSAEDALVPAQSVVIGRLDGVPCLAGSLPEGAALPPGTSGRDLFRLYGTVDDQTYAIAAYAYQIAYWQETGRFCPRSGHATTQNEVDWGRTCPACGHIGYPRVSPCAIVLIHDGADRVLLARQSAWPKGVYSLVAGFVEPSESLEDCVAREIREETGVEVEQIQYAGSQPWSFPHQLMVGFTARYAGGDLRIDPAELEDARWFDVDALPPLPPPQSIARRIIEGYVAARHR
jgi:NAD+ diphosphatase